jgi:hypothetical protein
LKEKKGDGHEIIKFLLTSYVELVIHNIFFTAQPVEKVIFS